MDPNACLIRLLEALRDDDRAEAQHAALDLAEWLGTGGFLPNVDAREYSDCTLWRIGAGA